MTDRHTDREYTDTRTGTGKRTREREKKLVQNYQFVIGVCKFVCGLVDFVSVHIA